MKVCPACHKEGKKSYSYPTIFVCDCLGVVEDISIIKQKMIPIDASNLFFGQVNYRPNRKEILGSIIGTNGNTYYFDLEKHSLNQGDFVRFKINKVLCENTNFQIAMAEAIEIIPAID